MYRLRNKVETIKIEYVNNDVHAHKHSAQSTCEDGVAFCSYVYLSLSPVSLLVSLLSKFETIDGKR